MMNNITANLFNQRQNKTKVGLKDDVGIEIRASSLSQNKTKVGLKGRQVVICE